MLMREFTTISPHVVVSLEKLYGLCKVHKDGNRMSPVISMIGTAEYKLAKYLDNFIKPNIDYSVNSTSSFMEKLNNFNFSEGDQCVSFDVCSLYTNVPLEETINLISDFVYSDKSKRVPLSLKNGSRNY